MAWVSAVASGAAGRTAPFASMDMRLPLVGTIGYVVLVTLGPRLMRSRPPLSLTGSMLIYNVYQAVFNAVSLAACVYVVVSNGFAWWGIPLDLSSPKQTGLGIAMYLHYR